MDVHGAGSQRSDPKAGDPSRFPYGRGPQGDVIRIYNFVRAVRGGKATPKTSGPKVEMTEAQHGGPGEGRRPEQGTPPGMRPDAGPGRERGPGNFSRFVQRLDRNRDGKVSKSEFDGPANHFDHLDRDGDGYLSESEMPQGPPRGNR